MNYINSSGQVAAIQAIRELHPNMSIPDGADLTDIGYAKIYPPVVIPEVGPNQVLVSMTPELVDGIWREVFAVEAAPVFVPQQVTMRQARLELLSRRLLDDVGAMIEAAGREVQIEWEYASTVDRADLIVADIQQQWGLTDAEIDDLFREAAKR